MLQDNTKTNYPEKNEYLSFFLDDLYIRMAFNFQSISLLIDVLNAGLICIQIFGKVFKFFLEHLNMLKVTNSFFC